MVVITWLGQNCAMVRGRLHEEPMADLKYIIGDKPPNYLPPVDIGRVSLGQDYVDVVYIDSADEEDPEMVWYFDLRGESVLKKGSQGL